jgi:HEAT repeat protein
MDGTLPTRGPWIRLAMAATVVVAPCFAGCSGFNGTTAASFLRKVREDPDPNVRYVAYNKLAAPQCYNSEAQIKEAVATMVEKLEQGKEPVATRAVICRTLGQLHDPSAREALIKAVSDNEGLVRAQACRSLGLVGRPEDATILSRVMTVDTLEDCRIAAIEGLGDLKAKDPRILEVLVLAMDHADPAIRFASLNALREITGKDLGVDPGPWRKEFVPQAAQDPATAVTAPALPATTR